ncbi:MAG: hypothetical protein ACK4SF_13030 [Algoriphagus aquaeductus]|uniref:Immunity protein 17 of polymorphic toxin system n=1 Tax=Algoriphagus aquaeductus TaxID=475299 RepID=A0A326RLP7_9BACT|nr:hypothetical protein [Algoriphagus aquaeductus]PZV78546.1 hypothetical protein CLV31_11754 [Algoriphagus aquaeductus]
MLEALKVLLLILLAASVASLLAGLYRPVYVLWFLDRFNRLKVLQVYGIASLILASLWILLGLLS